MGTILVSNLGKAYKQYPSRWARLAEWLMPFSGCRHETKWVLRDLSFEVQPGQALGIVGINGAGKSTLLKLITGTTEATTGSVRLNGRVAAMLELGMGFHPDFTGRQNVLLAGQLLGMQTQQVMELMPDVEAFAEIGDYIDQPVRVYSSGMQMRLAFSIATAVRPDILIVDEALSVGDTYFQHKSFERIRAFREQGTTLLIVSHDKGAIQSICDRAILLNEGRLLMEGSPEAVMDYYNALLASHQNQTLHQDVLENGKVRTVSGTGEAVTERIALVNAEGVALEVVDVGQSVCLQVDVRIRQTVDRLVLGYSIKDRLGQVVYGTNTELTGQPVDGPLPGKVVRYRVFFPANLGPGTYSIQTALVSTDTHLVNNYEWRDLAIIFTVVNSSKSHFAGTAWIPSTIQVDAE